MAKPGAPSRIVRPGGDQSEGVRGRLIDAAIETLKRDGFVGASARAIAEEAGATQSLIFYHFGSVANLLLMALDRVSSDRFEQYGAAVSDVNSLSELIDAATDIFRNDLEAGYITVLVELIAGASSSRELGEQVALRLEPWKQFAQDAVERAIGDQLVSLVPADDIAYAVMALYLGMEMLSHLSGDREPALSLFARAKSFAPLLEAVGGGLPSRTGRE